MVMFKSVIVSLFKRWQDGQYQISREAKEKPMAIANIGHSLNSDRGINFTVYRASGGTIIETSFYDNIKDRNFRGLYVITDDQDVGYEIGRIITMETLKI